MSDTTKPETSASVIGVEGRRVLIYVGDAREAENRFAFSVDGEPVAQAKIAVHRQDFAKGLNLIVDGRFEDAALPWRVVGDAAGTLGRNLSEKWHLGNGFTAYLSAAPGALAQVEYVAEDGRAGIPIIGGEDYRFAGYFGTHRCQASVRIDLLDEDDSVIASFDEPIPKKLGGQALDDYGHVDMSFATRSRCTHARIRLAINQYLPSNGVAKGEAFLFFTHLAFGIAGKDAAICRIARLSADQVVELTRGAAVLDVTLPRLSGASIGLAPCVDIIDTRTNEPAAGSPIQLPAVSTLGFRTSGFDGVTLMGELTGATGETTLELLVDGEVAGRLERPEKAGEGPQQVKIRVKDEFLDGSPHVVELRESETGRTLFINAAVLKSFVTPWEMLADFSRSPLPFELHVNARQRYRSLAEHMQALALPSADDVRRRAQLAQLVGQSYAIVASTPDANDCQSKLALPPEKDPDVSIILSASDVQSAYRSIAAIVFAYNKTRYEIIVAVDDAECASRLSELVSGVEIVDARNDAGGARLCNRAVAGARARFVALLKAPAEPGAFWLDELRLAFDLFEGVGLAGSKLVKPNGSLQEAGGIVWSSGNRQPVGANGNAEHPQVNYVRQVDYVSASAMMVARETWDAVGGLSEDLLDPDIEAVDLACKVRSSGRKVAYAPQSVVISGQRIARQQTGSGFAEGSGARHAFKRKWAGTYLGNHAEGRPVPEAMDSGICGRILFIDQQVPRIDIDAGSYAAIQEARLFQALGYKVTFLPMNLTHLGVYTRVLQRMGIEVIHAPFASSVEDVVKERGDEFDLVYITRYQVARAVLPFVRRYNPGAKVIFNNADLHFLRELRSALAHKNAEMLRRSKLTRDLELEVMRQVDLTISYSEVEHAVIQSHNFDETRIAKAPWVVTPVTSVMPFAERRNIAFVGSFGHQPNRDAVGYFVSEVMPILRRKLPAAKFEIFGSQIGPEIKAMEAHDVAVKGHVDSLAEIFSSTRVFVAPLVAGAGLKGKVLAAMSFGVPSVLSPAAAEGIGAQTGVHFLAANTPQEWADAISALYDDEKAWKKISQGALEFVRSHYTFDQGLDTLRRALEMINVFPARTTSALWCRLPLPPLL